MTQNSEMPSQERLDILISTTTELAQAVEQIRASVNALTDFIGAGDTTLRSGITRAKLRLPSKSALDSIAKELAAISSSPV